jgi:hypothetical protein
MQQLDTCVIVLSKPSPKFYHLILCLSQGGQANDSLLMCEWKVKDNKLVKV